MSTVTFFFISKETKTFYKSVQLWWFKYTLLCRSDQIHGDVPMVIQCNELQLLWAPSWRRKKEIDFLRNNPFHKD